MWPISVTLAKAHPDADEFLEVVTITSARRWIA